MSFENNLFITSPFCLFVSQGFPSTIFDLLNRPTFLSLRLATFLTYFSAFSDPISPGILKVDSISRKILLRNREKYYLNSFRGSSHEPARFCSARAIFSVARPGSLVNSGSSFLSVKWLFSEVLFGRARIGSSREKTGSIHAYDHNVKLRKSRIIINTL